MAVSNYMLKTKTDMRNIPYAHVCFVFMFITLYWNDAVAKSMPII